MIEPIVEALKPLVADELERANKLHPQFHSPHEGWAVIREEIVEAEAEMGMVGDHEEALEDAIHRDDYVDANMQVAFIRDCAIRLAAEAIQVAAMCDKWKPYGEVEK